jgi:hypothetical protein
MQIQLNQIEELAGRIRQLRQAVPPKVHARERREEAHRLWDLLQHVVLKVEVCQVEQRLERVRRDEVDEIKREIRLSQHLADVNHLVWELFQAPATHLYAGWDLFFHVDQAWQHAQDDAMLLVSLTVLPAYVVLFVDGRVRLGVPCRGYIRTVGLSLP